MNFKSLNSYLYIKKKGMIIFGSSPSYFILYRVIGWQQFISKIPIKRSFLPFRRYIILSFSLTFFSFYSLFIHFFPIIFRTFKFSHFSIIFVQRALRTKIKACSQILIIFLSFMRINRLRFLVFRDWKAFLIVFWVLIICERTWTFLLFDLKRNSLALIFVKFP